MRLGEHFFEVVCLEQITLRGFGVLLIGIFGSCARGDETANSDVDVFVEFEKKTFDNYMGLKLFLEEKMSRRIDLVTLEALRPALKEDILREVKYAA